MHRLGFHVDGEPGPQGSKTFKGMVTSKKTGNKIGRLVESSAKVKPWRKAITDTAAQLFGEGPPLIVGPVHLNVIFWMPLPKSAPKRRRIEPAVKPDLSKLIRSTEDAITDAQLWEDDGRVLSIAARVSYAYPSDHPQWRFGDRQPGAYIEIMGL